MRVKKDGNWTLVSSKGLANRIRLGDADGRSRLVEGCVNTVLVQLEDPVADAALGDEPEEDQKEAATFAETLESEGESSGAETLKLGELPHEAFD